jgi:hypothetical protein
VSFASTLLRSGALVLVAAVTVVSVGAAGTTVRRGVEEEDTSLVAGDQAAAMVRTLFHFLHESQLNDGHLRRLWATARW